MATPQYLAVPGTTPKAAQSSPPSAPVQPVTLNPAFPATAFQQAPVKNLKNYSGFTSRKEEELYD